MYLYTTNDFSNFSISTGWVLNQQTTKCWNLKFHQKKSSVLTLSPRVWTLKFPKNPPRSERFNPSLVSFRMSWTSAQRFNTSEDPKMIWKDGIIDDNGMIIYDNIYDKYIW